MTRPAPNPLRYLRQLTRPNGDNPIHFPRRPLAVLAGVTYIGAGMTVTPVVLPRSVWTISYVAAGFALFALAAGLDSVGARAGIAALAGAAVAARSVAVTASLIVPRFAQIPPPTIGVVVWPTLGVFVVVLVAFWKRLE